MVSTHFPLCSLLLFPYTAQCFFLSGACYASVLGWLLEEFHDFLREGATRLLRSILVLLFSGRGGPTVAVLGYVIDMPVIVHVKVVDIPFVAQRLFLWST